MRGSHTLYRLEWICGSARAGTDRNGPAGTVWTHVTRSKPKAREGLVTVLAGVFFENCLCGNTRTCGEKKTQAPECRELLQWLRRLDVSEPFASLAAAWALFGWGSFFKKSVLGEPTYDPVLSSALERCCTF